MYSKTRIMKSTKTYWDNEKARAFGETIKRLLENAEAVVVGAGAGLSASAGFTYSGKRFEENFPDFIKKYGFGDMYSAGFYPYETEEEYWAYWSRYIFLNRYQDAPKNLYQDLFALIKDKDYFVLTTNVDHCFKRLALTSKGCFIPRATMGFGSAQSPVTTRPMIMKLW